MKQNLAETNPLFGISKIKRLEKAESKLNEANTTFEKAKGKVDSLEASNLINKIDKLEMILEGTSEIYGDLGKRDREALEKIIQDKFNEH